MHNAGTKVCTFVAIVITTLQPCTLPQIIVKGTLCITRQLLNQ